MGKFHAKMGTIKDRNGMDLTESEENKKKWWEDIGELCKKGPNDQITTMVWSLTQSQLSQLCSQVGLTKHHYKQS